MRIPNPLTFIRAMLRAFRRRKEGPFVLSDQSRIEGRRAICYGCVFYDHRFNQCNVCTCNVAMKTLIRTESCPQGKW